MGFGKLWIIVVGKIELFVEFRSNFRVHFFFISGVNNDGF